MAEVNINIGNFDKLVEILAPVITRNNQGAVIASNPVCVATRYCEVADISLAEQEESYTAKQIERKRLVTYNYSALTTKFIIKLDDEQYEILNIVREPKKIYMTLEIEKK